MWNGVDESPKPELSAYSPAQGRDFMAPVHVSVSLTRGQGLFLVTPDPEHPNMVSGT